jgi:outer membrane immunogenic protein
MYTRFNFDSLFSFDSFFESLVMKRLFVVSAAASICAFSYSATAADLTLKAPPTVVATWTGLYAGATIGYGQVLDSASYQAVEPIFYGGAITRGEIPRGLNPPARGFLGGATFGYNYQPGANYVVGFETDISYSDVKGTRTFVSTPILFDPTITTQQTNRLNWLGTARLRGGVLATPSLLAYVTGGLAYGEVSAETHTSVSQGLVGAPPTCGPTGNIWCGDGSASKLRLGWTVGAGLEQALPHGWSLKAEYLYYDLGNVSYPFFTQSPPPPLVMTVDSSAKGHIGRIGLNFRFGAMGQ